MCIRDSVVQRKSGHQPSTEIAERCGTRGSSHLPRRQLVTVSITDSLQSSQHSLVTPSLQGMTTKRARNGNKKRMSGDVRPVTISAVLGAAAFASAFVRLIRIRK